MLVSRLITSVLAVAIAFMPSALDACQAVCAMHASEPVQGTEHATSTDHAHQHNTTAIAAPTRSEAPAHSCDDAEAPQSPAPPTVSGNVHGCGHVDELPANAGANARLLFHAPTVLPTALEPPADVAHRQAWLPSRLPSDPPAVLALPLRV